MDDTNKKISVDEIDLICLLVNANALTEAIESDIKYAEFLVRPDSPIKREIKEFEKKYGLENIILG